MSFRSEPGRIEVTNAAGQLRIDTDDGMFHTINRLTGSQSIAAVSATSSQRNLTTDYVLGSCHEACTHVVGDMRFTGSGSWGASFNRWTTYLGGDLVWAMTAPGLTSGTAGDILLNPHTFVSYRFFCSGGVVRMRRRLIMASFEGTFTLLAHGIQYDLECGLFT